MRSRFILFIILLMQAAVSSLFAFGAERAKVISIATQGDELAFKQVKLTAKAGQPIKLTFTNQASKASGMAHNFVLVQPGSETDIAAASIAAGAENGWLAVGPKVIAHTKLLNPGESDTIQFVAPAKAGDYPYFCSFPGHSAIMKGVFTLK